MEIKEILQLPLKDIKQHIHTLANEYKNITGGDVCLSCSGDVKRMLNFLKKYNMNTQFELRKPNVIYKIKWGDARTISNDKMTDELAIAFLKEKPSRIELFSKYPDNWKELLSGNSSNEEDNDEEKVPIKPTKKPCTTCKKKTANNSKRKSNDSK
ncbi:hypothetical protein [Corallibacter sp.]|uniref:hypothetical protein n=1 Tax=Corallibacter sp. TaxID=2038084 RepID=UPI003AB76199